MFLRLSTANVLMPLSSLNISMAIVVTTLETT